MNNFYLKNSIQELKKAKSLTITLLVLKFILLFSSIIFFALLGPSFLLALSNAAADRPSDPNGFGLFSAAILLLTFGFALFCIAIAAFIIHIIVCVKSYKIDNTSFILLLVGFFISIVDLVGGFILVSKINKQIDQVQFKTQFNAINQNDENINKES